MKSSEKGENTVIFRNQHRFDRLLPKSYIVATMMTETTTVPRRPYPFLRKPLWVIQREEREGLFSSPQEQHHQQQDGSSNIASTTQQEQNSNNSSRHASERRLQRHMSLLDLVSIGVGGTIGSGVFVLCGLIARDYAGPATFISWAIAGAAAFLSGCCYAELSGRIPSAGSSYAYAYVSMGELPAVVTAAMLTLEFLVSGAAVARSWGDKVVEWLRVEMEAGDWVNYLDPGYGFNPMATLVSFVTSVLVFGGVKESKIVTDIFTWVKVLLVVFMAVGGLFLFDASNMKPLFPFGFSGVMRGATSSFFGYLGYDGICCVAGEAKNPTMNLPRSVMITLVLVTVLYIVAAFALTGMQHYTEISPESGFPEAFASRGVEWAAQLTAAGEIITLPVVVLLSSVLQPRLFYAMAWDGFLPPLFRSVDAKGNLRKGIFVSGSIMTLLASFVPFTYLDDFVSAGILIAFSITNSSLIIMRRDSPQRKPFLLEKMLLLFSFLSLVTGMVLRHALESAAGRSLALCLSMTLILLGCALTCFCPETSVFGGRTALTPTLEESSVQYFQTPCMPLIPLLGTFTNWYLVAQLDYLGIFLLMLYLGLAVTLYWMYGAKNSVGNNTSWGQREYEEIEMTEEEAAATTTTTQNGDESLSCSRNLELT